MTVAAEPSIASALRRAAVRATLAPSVHNTQPWRFERYDDQLDIYADPSRQRRVLDPTRRQLTISCGCAVFNARAAVAAGGLEPIAARFPDPGQPDLVARVGGTRRRGALADALTAYDRVVELRRTNRRRFGDDDVPAEVIDSLESAAAAEGGPARDPHRGPAPDTDPAGAERRRDSAARPCRSRKAEHATPDPRLPCSVPKSAAAELVRWKWARRPAV